MLLTNEQISILNKNEIQLTKSFFETLEFKKLQVREYILQGKLVELWNGLGTIEDNTEKLHFQLFFLDLFYNSYSLFCLSDDLEILDSLKRFVISKNINAMNVYFSENSFKWFISGKRIDEILEQINSTGNFYIEPIATKILIHNYLTTKFFCSILKPLNLVNKRIPLDMDSITREITNTKRNAKNRESSGKKNSYNSFEEKWFSLLSEIELKSEIVDFTKELLKVPNRNYDNTLLNIFYDLTHDIKDNYSNKKISLNEKYRIFYPLFQLILKDRNWCESELVFKLSDEGSGKNFSQYMTKKMQKFFSFDKY